MNKIRALFNQSSVKKKVDLNCQHYQRLCLLLSPCCRQWIGCRFCHDEQQLCDLKFDRFKVSIIKCTQCGEEQSPSNSCSKCQTKFAKSYCQKCNVWTNDPIFHCNDCGFCRVGKAEEYFHCQNCDACFPKSHECVQTKFKLTDRKTTCPICFEILFESKKQYLILQCGHKIHSDCFHSNINHQNYRCPMCKKSAIDMTSVWNRMKIEKNLVLMPEEYRETKIRISCQDCGLESETVFHVVGLECSSCGSFNTQRI